MVRQLWIFLDGADEGEIIARLSAVRPLRRLDGRFFRGTADDLRRDPEALVTAQLKQGERWVHLIQPEVSKELVVHPVTEGPFAGWSRLDEVRSEVLTLVRVEKDAQGLAPSRLQAASHAWFGGEKIRKSVEFTRWMTQAMSAVETAYPATEYDWIRIGPAALEWAREGGRLHYLYKQLGLAPAEAAPHTPHRRL